MADLSNLTVTIRVTVTDRAYIIEGTGSGKMGWMAGGLIADLIDDQRAPWETDDTRPWGASDG